MASYNIDVVLSSGTWTPTIRRGGTAASGGTVVTLPKREFETLGATATGRPYLAFDICARAILNRRATSGTEESFSITLADSSGNFTPTLRVGATVASGGTVLALAPQETKADALKHLNSVLALARNRTINDRATNG